MMTQVSPAGSEDSDVGQLLPAVPPGYGPPPISLALLMDFAIQQTFHELTILAEMLPNKEQPERKKAIVQFAHASRLMFVKLLSIVKWLRTSKKFEPLASITYFLDVQSNQFVETADRLYELSRVELQKARLPLFQVSTAIDVLTTGTFPRLPMIIKDAFVPEEKLSPYETRQAILLLNERLVFYMIQAAPTLPKRVSIFRVHNGTIVMRVKGEFQLRITVLPRKKPEFVLLSVAVLVRDYDIGGGMELVHPLQLNALHEAVQARITHSNEPFLEAYRIMHSFALSLQLDVLECQTRKLSSEIAPNYVKVEAYNPHAGFLLIRYWINDKPASSTQTRIQKLLANSVQYKMRIYIDREDQDSGILIRHEPPSAVKMISKVPSDRQLSIGRLLSEVIEIRIRERLLMVRQLLNQVPPGVRVHLAGDAAPTLIYELLVHEKKSHLDEQLIVSVNAFFGHIVCQVHCIGQHEELRNLEKELNGPCQLAEVTRIIKRLRVLLMINRYMRAISCLPMIQVISEAQLPVMEKLKGLPKDRILMQFSREPNYYLVVGFIPSGPDGLEVKFRIITVNDDKKLSSMELDPMISLDELKVPKFYEPVKSVTPNEPESMEVDAKSQQEVVRGPARTIDNDRRDKDTRWTGEEGQVKLIIASIEDRIAFLRIAEELEKKGIGFEPVQIDKVTGGPYLKITDLSSLGATDCEDFFETVCSAIVRMDTRRNFVWPFEYTLKDPPLIPNFYQNRIMSRLKVVPENTLIAKMIEYENDKSAVSHVYKTIVQDILTTLHQSLGESIATNIIDKVAIFSHLYGPVKRFSLAYNYFENAIDVICYTYHKLILAYGPHRNFTVNISWRPQTGTFVINLGQFYYQPMLKPKYRTFEKKTNPHLIVQPYLVEKFNGDRDLIDLMNYLINTTLSIECLIRLSRLRVRSLKAYQMIVQSESQSSFPMDYQVYIHAVKENKIRVHFGGIHLEFLLLSENAVSVKDVTPDKPMAIGLIPFFKSFKKISEKLNFISYPDLKNKRNDGKNGEFNPASVPSNSGKNGTQISNPRSVPDDYVTGRYGSSDMEDGMSDLDPYMTSRESIYVSSRLLMRVCTDMDQQGIPIDNYFTALIFLTRFGRAMEVYKESDNAQHIPFKDISIELSHVTISTSTIQLSKDQGGVVTANFYLCPEQYRLKSKLMYSSVNMDVPKEIETRIALRYFDQCVAPLMNEYAVLSFLNLCRICVNGVFDSITRIMEAQMAPDPAHFWRVSLQLAPINQQSDANTTLGATFNVAETNMVISICLRPNKVKGKERFTERKYYDLTYTFATNHVSIKQSSKTEEDPILQPIVQAQAESSRKFNELCPLWSCIRVLLEKNSLTE